MSIDEFLKKYEGKYIDYDGYFGSQCVDLIQQYNKEVFGGPFLVGQGAADIWETYPTEIYDRFLNTVDFIPQLGDIVIWKKTTSLPYGHIAIVKSAEQTKFTSMDQNWPTNGKCQYIEHNYENPMVLGFLRAKKIPSSIPVDEWKAKYDEKVQLESFLRGEIQKKDDTINNLNKQISELENNKIILANQLNVCQSSMKEHEGCQSKILEATNLKNQAEQDLATARGSWSLKEVALNKQIALLTTKYNATKSSLKKLLVDYIFGKTV
jgi:surface antigen